MGGIRLFLALVVVTGHFSIEALLPFGLHFPPILTLGMNAGFAVMFFYMISGFLISTALSEKYTGRTAEFYRNRFIRIFSLYWPLALGAFLFSSGAWSHLVLADQITNVTLLGADWRVAFASYPDQHFEAVPPQMAQAWTLGAELAFYVAAPWLLRSWRWSLAALVASALIRAGALIYWGGFNSPWTYTFFPSTALFFLLGHFARVLSVHFDVLRHWLLGVALLAISIAAFTAGPWINWDTWRFWTAALCFAAALPSVFAATKNARFLNLLGDLSFPVYLIHVIAIGVLLSVGLPATLVGLLQGSSPNAIATEVTLLCLIGILIAAALAHFLIERPVATAMHWAMGRAIQPRRPLPERPRSM